MEERKKNKEHRQECRQYGLKKATPEDLQAHKEALEKERIRRAELKAKQEQEQFERDCKKFGVTTREEVAAIKEKIAAEEEEKRRIEAEKRAEEYRIREEKMAEEKRIKEEKWQQHLEREKQYGCMLVYDSPISEDTTTAKLLKYEEGDDDNFGGGDKPW